MPLLPPACANCEIGWLGLAIFAVLPLVTFVTKLKNSKFFKRNKSS